MVEVELPLATMLVGKAVMVEELTTGATGIEPHIDI